MGVVANANQYLSKKVTSATHKVIDGVTRAAALTPGQVQEVEKEREKYLMWMSDMKDEQVQDLINRNSHRPNISPVISGYKQPSKSAQSIEITGFIEKSKPPKIIFLYTLLPLTA